MPVSLPIPPLSFKLAHWFRGFVVLLSGTVPSNAFATTRVDLVLNEASAERSVAWPVTTGVPFPQGALVDEQQCRLVDDRGVEQPLQTEATAYWDVQRRSIRWLTIDFIAHPGRRYALEFGNDLTKRRTAASPLNTTRQDDGGVRVRTGILEVDFSRPAARGIQSIRVDLRGDGRQPFLEVARGASTGTHSLATSTRQATAKQPATRAASSQQEVVIESSGPVRAVVRVDGWYDVTGLNRSLRFRTRYHFFAGLPVIKAVDEFQIAGSTRDLLIHDLSLPLEIVLDPKQRQVAAAVGNERDAAPRSWPWNVEDTKEFSLSQETFRHYGNLECRAAMRQKKHSGEELSLAADERARGWLQVSDERTAITGALRWFSQQFPKEWSVTGDRLTCHLWSLRGGDLDFSETGLRTFFGAAGEKYLLDWKGVRPAQSPIEKFFYFAGRYALARDGADGLGINKHHEVWWRFDPVEKKLAGREFGELVENQPLCLPTGKWNCDTGVFGPLAARPNDSPHEAIVDRIFDLERYAQDHFGDYGWWLFGAGPHYSYQWDAEAKRHYADPRRFEYHTYQRETQLWWCYLRSGERKFFDWALPSENHWVDFAVSHHPTTFSTEWRGGKPNVAQQKMHWPAGDWSIDSPLHFVRHHDTGEAWLRGASQFWGSYHRTLETTTLAYFLTGDRRYLDVVDFWRSYWGGLAGVRSDSRDVPAWHREQVWFQPTAPGEPSKSWAEMLRDYAPFQSGSRHQMTLLFNLATLYEQTWDPQIRIVLNEYANAFLDPAHPTGVWRSHDHRPPANADSPRLAHYWAPALWKYARASADPRMPDILQRYFTACHDADPFGGDVGIYSNNQIAWAWHFTRDPRHLAAAQRELEILTPNAHPLERPESLGERIYNPHQPVRALTATPRLIAVLDEAKQLGIEPTIPSLTPQRTWIAVRQTPGQALSAQLWGWDKDVRWRNETGNTIGTASVPKTHLSHHQPFDRVPAGHQVFSYTVDAPVNSTAEWRFLAPRVEVGMLRLTGGGHLRVWGGEPVEIEPLTRPWRWRREAGAAQLKLESAQVGKLRVSRDGQPLAIAVEKNTAKVALENIPAGEWLEIENTGSNSIWFRIADLPDEQRWLAPPRAAVDRDAKLPPAPPRKDAALPAPPTTPLSKDAPPQFVPGRFGQALRLESGREFKLPDEFVAPDGSRERLVTREQGTIEFWIRREWDERVAPASLNPTFLSNGEISVYCPSKLPLREWAHVAFVWRPSLPDSKKTWLHIYVNGRDFATYRNLYWEGYAPPPNIGAPRERLQHFVIRALPNMPFAIDDLRISNVARYFDSRVNLGPQQTYNPFEFTPPAQTMPHDAATRAMYRFDGSGNSEFPAP